MQRDIPDVISLMGALATAIPASIRQVAVTNVPVFSSILNEEFLDGKRPQWFQELPVALQSYLIARFGIPTSATIASAVPTTPSSAFTTLPTLSDNAPSTPTIYRSRTLIPTDVQSPSQTVPTISSVTTLPPQSLVSSSTTSHLPTAHAELAASNGSGLHRNAKIGIAVGVPLGLLLIAALILACCCLRRRRRKSVDGSIPPSSPGFIPRFAFQEKDCEVGNTHRHLIPRTTHEHGGSDGWVWGSALAKPGLDRETHREDIPAPTMAPAVCHTHSSNRARGRRTSYTSLNTVQELSEPGDMRATANPPKPVSSSQPSLIMASSVASQIKRKPVSSPPLIIPALRQGHATETPVSPVNNDAYSWPSSEMTYHPVVSPILPHASRAPSWGDDSYMEDYGPEYDDRAVYGGGGQFDASTSSSLHHLVEKDPSSEWPLKNNRSRNYHRSRSMMWDRVYHS